MQMLQALRILHAARTLHAAAISALAIIFFASSLSLIPFSSRGEAREAVVVQNMIQQDNLILPRRNGINIPSKPPLFHWLALSSAKITGELDEFSIRLPSALAATLALAALFLFVAAERGPLYGGIATVVMATAAEFTRSAGLARVDMVFAALQTVALILLYAGVLNIDSNSRLRLSASAVIGSGVALGLATLTKGPAGLVLPLLVFATFLAIATSWRRLPLLQLLCVALISTAIAATWYLAAYRVGGEEFLQVQVMRENVARLFGLKNYETGHSSPFFTSPLLFVSGFFPWSLFFPPLFVWLYTARRELFLPANRIALFSLVWIVVFFLFVTVSSSKRTVYLLPCFPALAILFATFFKEGLSWFLSLAKPATAGPEKAVSIKSRSVRFTVSALYLHSFLILVGVGVVYGIFLYGPQIFQLAAQYCHKLHDNRELVEIAVMTIVNSWSLHALFIAAVLGLYSGARELSQGNGQSCCFLTGLAAVALTLGINLQLYPVLADYNSPKGFMAAVAQQVPKEAPLWVYKEEYFSAVYYADRNLKPVDNIDGLSGFLLVAEAFVPELLSSHPAARPILVSHGRAAYGDDRLALLELSATE